MTAEQQYEIEQRLRKTEAGSRILAERKRQIYTEAFVPNSDDKYIGGELAIAAECYTRYSLKEAVLHKTVNGKAVPVDWIWNPKWWKPTTPLRNLEKAGALLLAENARILRLPYKERRQHTLYNIEIEEIIKLMEELIRIENADKVQQL